MMSDTLSLVSIVMPAYNAEKYIEEAIQSVLMQTYKHWELIVIDDGSTDNTRSIIDTFKDKRIHLISQENAGVSAARNRGIDIVKGEYITFLDADDTLSNISLKSRVSMLKNNKKLDVVHGIVSIKDELLNREMEIYKTFSHKNLFKMILNLDKRVSYNPSYMIRRSSLGTIKFIEGMTHCEDMLFMIELFVQDIQYAYVDKVVYNYRVSNNSAMNNTAGLVMGYFKLLSNLKKMSLVPYKKTIIMRIKISRILFSWYISQNKIYKIYRIINVFYEK